MATTDMSRLTTGVTLDPEVSAEIWADTQEASAIMRVSRRIDLPGAGLTIPMITGDPTASWVDEGNEIGVSDSTLSSKSMTGYKLAVIETFSNEFKRDLPGMFAALRARLPKTLGVAFDTTVMSGVAPGSNFDALDATVTQASKLVAASAYDDLVAIDGLVAAANAEVTDYILAPKARGVLLGAKDADERPLLFSDIQGGVSNLRLLGANLTYSRNGLNYDDDGGGAGTQKVLGYAGDFANSAFFGVVQDIEVSVTDQSTVNKGGTQVNLWQRDMFAVKATVHLGFIVRDAARFVKVRDAA